MYLHILYKKNFINVFIKYSNKNVIISSCEIDKFQKISLTIGFKSQNLSTVTDALSFGYDIHLGLILQRSGRLRGYSTRFP